MDAECDLVGQDQEVATTKRLRDFGKHGESSELRFLSLKLRNGRPTYEESHFLDESNTFFATDRPALLIYP